MGAITLRGMTWSHPRGYDPMVACARDWRARTGVSIEWDKRSLQDFESFPVEDLARRYDLIVIDHPHVGQITAEGCLTPLDLPGREAAFAALADGIVGLSLPSYSWQAANGPSRSTRPPRCSPSGRIGWAGRRAHGRSCWIWQRPANHAFRCEACCSSALKPAPAISDSLRVVSPSSWMVVEISGATGVLIRVM